MKRRSFQSIVNDVAADNARQLLARAACCRKLTKCCRRRRQRRILHDLETAALTHLFNKFRVQILAVENQAIESSVSADHHVEDSEPQLFEWRRSLPVEMNIQVAVRL